MLEATPASAKERSRLRRRAVAGETLNSTSCFVLAKAESCRVELLRHDGTINNFDCRDVLGEKIECRSEAFHPSM